MSPFTTGTDRGEATFGRYAETPYDQMTPEQQRAYRILAKAEGGELQGPAKIWVDNANLATAVAPLGRPLPSTKSLAHPTRTRDRRLRHPRQVACTVSH